MKKRTEDQIISNTGLSLRFTGIDYPFKERNIRRTKEWMQKFVDQDGSVLTKVTEAAKANEKDAILASLGYDNLAALVSDYTDGAVTVDQIEDGTVKELEKAFNKILRVAGFFDVVWGKTRELQGKDPI